MQTYRLLLCAFGGLLLNCLDHVVAIGQSAPVPLQQVRFISKVMEDRVISYAAKTRARFLELSIQPDTTKNTTHYTLRQLGCYEEVVQFTLSTWGQWRNGIILFHPNQFKLASICTITDTTKLLNLRKYADKNLPRRYMDIPGTNVQEIRDCDSNYLVLRFTVRNGRIVAYGDNYGPYSHQDVPDSLPLVPESTRNP